MPENPISYGPTQIGPGQIRGGGSGGIAYQAGPGISIGGSSISVRADGSTVTTDSSGRLTVISGGTAYSAGSGIDISNDQISVSVDSSTVGFDSNGALSCMVSGGSGGGQTYSAGPGIEISGGGISLASDALEKVPQVLVSGGKIVQQGSDGGYISLTSAGSVTIGTNGGYRFSGGAGTVAVKTQNSTGLFAADNTLTLKTSGATRLNCSGRATYIYGTTTAGGLLVSAYGNSGSVKVKSNNGSYEDIITESSYATSSTPGIVQPDNSTCEVAGGGILSVKPPALTWHIADGGSMVSAPETSSAALTKVYINGLLAQPDEDYSLAGGMITLSASIASGGKVVTEVYPAAAPEPGRSLRNAAGGGSAADPEDQEEDPAEDAADQEAR